MTDERDLELFTKYTPPDLEGLLGYFGTRKWVAFFWGKKIGNSSLCYGFDGNAFNPVNLTAWDAFISHPLIVAINQIRENGHVRKRFEFGNDQMTSEHWLLLDRHQRILYAARKETAMDYVRKENKRLESLIQSHDLDPSFHALSHQPDQPANGALQMINDMLQYLDLALLR